MNTYNLLKKHDPHLFLKLTYSKFSQTVYQRVEEEIILEDVPVLYVYGLNQGALYSKCKEWLENHQLVILDDDLEHIHSSLKTVETKQLLSHPNVHFRYYTNTILQELTWKFFGKEYRIYCSSAYKKIKKENFKKISEKIQWFSVWVRYQAWGDIDRNHVFFENFFNNLSAWHKAKDVSFLGRCFEKIPAFICGAGPSIEQDVIALKERQNNGLIIAGGSAINVLTAADIIPHITLGLDPTTEECARFRNNRAYEVPFFYRMRLHHQALNLVHGPRGYITGTGYYPIERDIEKKYCHKVFDIEEGVSVTCFATELAANLGCDPIILIGSDLSYTDQRRYAKGVKKEQGIDAEFQDNWFGAVKAQDQSGKEVISQWKWIIESKFLSTCPWRYTNRFINASQRGLEIESFERSLLDKIELNREYDLKGMLHTYLQQTRFVQPNVENYINDLRESLKNCEVYVETLLDELYLALDEDPCQYEKRPKVFLTEIQLKEEMAFKNILASFSEMLKRVKDPEEKIRSKAEELLYLQTQIDRLLNLSNHTHLTYFEESGY